MSSLRHVVASPPLAKGDLGGLNHRLFSAANAPNPEKQPR